MPFRCLAPAGRRAFARLGLALGLAAAVLPLRAADEPRPVVGPGATRDEVLAAYGWPNGMSQSGTKEIFSYSQGNVTLEHGKVESVNFRPNVPWQAPRPRPGPPTASTRKDAPTDHWLVNFDEAAKEAARRNVRLLALFTGSDWSPASRQFHDEVEFHPDFVGAMADDFVLLRLDYPTRTAQALELREQNARLRQQYNVTSYPTLLVLSPAGASLAQVDLAKPVAGDSYLARVIAAVREVRGLLGAPAPVAASPPPPGAPNPSPQARVPAGGPPAGPAMTESAVVAAPLSSAGWLLMGAAAAGSGVAAFLFWLVWRRWSSSGAPRPMASFSSRIAEAASGVPSPAEINAWPGSRLRGVAAAVAESEGYAVEIRPEGGAADLAFARMGDAQARVLVCCLPGEAGPVSGKRMREFLAAIQREGATGGWYVAPAGFASEAQTQAERHGIVQIDCRALVVLLGNLPPLILPKVLARTA